MTRLSPTPDPVDVALATLATLDRAAVRLVYQSRYTQREAAELLSTTPDLVSAALLRAYRAITVALQPAPTVLRSVS